MRYAKDEVKKRRLSLILYLKDFSRGETKTLTTDFDHVYIQQLITLRDLRNNGMSRMEVIGIIQKMTKASFEKAEQHWYYCRREKKLPELKNHGALRTAQTTNTKRSGVTTDKLLHGHGTVDETLNELYLCKY